MKIFRRIVFFLFAAGFLIGAPRLVFYALGYSFQAGSEQGLVRSGLIFLSTAPPGAEIYVGGSRYRERTPAIIRDLVPGQYPIRLVLKDYYPWARSIPVEAGKAAVLGQVLLRPRQPEWREHLNRDYDRFTAIPKTHLLLLEGRRDGVFELYDWKSKKKQPVFALPQAKGNIKDVFVMPESPAVLAAVKGEEKTLGRWAKENGEDLWIDWSDASSEKVFDPQQIKWDGGDERYVFAFDRGLVKRADLYQKTAADFLTGVRGYTVANRRVYYFSGGEFMSVDVTGKNPKPIWKDTGRFLDGSGEVEITHAAPDTVFFLTQSGRLVTNHPPRIITEAGARGLQYDKKNEKLLYWTDHEIGVAGWTSRKTEAGDSALEITKKTVFSGGQKIETAFWAHDGAYIVYQDKDKVFLLERQSFAEPLVYELFEVKSGSLAFYSDDSGEVFYLDKRSGYLMSLELIPKWKVMEVPLALIRENEAKEAV